MNDWTGVMFGEDDEGNPFVGDLRNYDRIYGSILKGVDLSKITYFPTTNLWYKYTPIDYSGSIFKRYFNQFSTFSFKRNCKKCSYWTFDTANVVVNSMTSPEKKELIKKIKNKGETINLVLSWWYF